MKDDPKTRDEMIAAGDSTTKGENRSTTSVVRDATNQNRFSCRQYLRIHSLSRSSNDVSVSADGLLAMTTFLVDGSVSSAKVSFKKRRLWPQKIGKYEAPASGDS
jgi:hypothetical protein